MDERPEEAEVLHDGLGGDAVALPHLHPAVHLLQVRLQTLEYQKI